MLIADINSIGKRRVHAVAGIAQPQGFFDSLATLGLDAVPHVFPDHHVFSAHDFEFDECLPVVMTEKDATKCTRLGLENAYALRVDVQTTEKLSKQFLDLVSRACSSKDSLSP